METPAAVESETSYQQLLDSTFKSFLEENVITGHEILTEKQWIKCYCLSDMHADQMHNVNWVHNNCERKAEDAEFFTVFIVPGDIGYDVYKIEAILVFLKLNFDVVCYLPGNHVSVVAPLYIIYTVNVFMAILNCT